MRRLLPYDMVQEDVEELVLDEISTESGETSQIVVYNDDVNTFDWVIECFMDILEHTFEQSEQLSILIHFKGKASVKTAPYRVLKPQKDALVERGLSAVIEHVAD
ncbi:MAG: ATP-dependent Clp protease adaptor ClpS [Saprospiraceae bacterium]|nr:ATP-dependent Clp protease adaptor ClpS [Saprospiraceae bacterium]